MKELIKADIKKQIEILEKNISEEHRKNLESLNKIKETLRAL